MIAGPRLVVAVIAVSSRTPGRAQVEHGKIRAAPWNPVGYGIS